MKLIRFDDVAFTSEWDLFRVNFEKKYVQIL